MDLIRFRVLWIPLIFALSLFAIDKIFFLGPVRRATQHWSKLEDYFYGSRERLFRLLAREEAARATDPGADGVVLLFGSSRSAPFPVAGFAREFPRARFYNFSAPGAVPSYYYYWHSRIRQDFAPRIQLAVIEIDAGLFTRSALQPSLAYSYDPAFVLKHLDWGGDGAGFSFDSAETFFARQYFAFLKYPLRAGDILENQRVLRFVHEGRPVVTTQLALKDKLFAMMDASFENLRGGVPYPVEHALGPDALLEHARDAASRYPGDERTRKSQMYFLGKLLEELARDRVPVLIYWPVVARPLRERLEAAGLVREWQEELRARLTTLERDYPGARLRLIDVYEGPYRLECREFSDSYHLAGACFDELTRQMLRAFRAPRE